MKNEKDYFNNAKVPNFMDPRERYGNLKKYCCICSEYTYIGERLVKHIHNSSKHYRISAPADLWETIPALPAP